METVPQLKNVFFKDLLNKSYIFRLYFKCSMVIVYGFVFHLGMVHFFTNFVFFVSFFVKIQQEIM